MLVFSLSLSSQAGGTLKIKKAKARVENVQTRCIVKGEAQKGPLSGEFLGVFDFLTSDCSLGIPLEIL